MGILQLLLATAGCASSQARPEVITVDTIRPFEVVAHRGASEDCPENTMAAFRQAETEGADRIELDVQLTRDGRVIVMHDETIDRTSTGRGAVAEVAITDLEGLDAGSWFSSDFASEPIPSLEDVLAWTASSGMHLNIELKNHRGDLEARQLARAVVALLGEDESALAEVQISSFDRAAVAEAADACPRCDVALLWEANDDEDPLEVVAETGADSLNLSHRYVTARLVSEAHRSGVPIRVYTVNDEADIRRAMALGVDAIITDRPEEARAALDGP